MGSGHWEHVLPTPCIMNADHETFGISRPAARASPTVFLASWRPVSVPSPKLEDGNTCFNIGTSIISFPPSSASRPNAL
ncbi:hypothetical protein M404DRAFT_999230 [Pisolithus tinctorius Marx 270]|uniref:Uncharacterized protein n=1 Tax=Pisolithus tinctorius Marx 270 TaxID=870435 RepID=A0A0C3NYV4_PISTI|nr:hypothetical protein M404DRAFT_999230 [Pisolithus tinctorius Marx 270]